jgi:VanZ family protein
MTAIACFSLVDLQTANKLYVNPIIKYSMGLVTEKNWYFVQKAGHFVTWAMLGFMSLFAFTKIKGHAYTMLFLFVAFIEICQYKVPGRFPLVSDVLISWSGLASALLMYYLTGTKKKLKSFIQAHEI